MNKYQRCVGILLASAALLGFASMGQAGAGDDVALSFDPKAIHRQMWEDMKPRLASRAEMETAWLTKTATNWREYDMDYYRIDLEINHGAQVIYGRVGIYGTVVVPSLDSVMVDLLDTLTVDSVYDQSGSLVFEHLDDRVTVHLDKEHVQGESFYFTVVYRGKPASSGGFLGFSFSSRNGLPLITTLSEPMGARSWWPCNDIPRDKVDSVDIIVTVDTSLVVSSNGLVVSDVDNGNGTHTTHWKSRYPIAPYLISLAVHPYAVWHDWYKYSPVDSMPLDFYVYPDESLNSRQYFKYVVAHMLTVLAGPFGLYPFIEEKYGCTHFNWGGAMEHQTNTSTTSSAFGYSQPVVVHELAHQWWGDMVTCSDWHHIWMNEGFATYAEALYFEADSGINYYHAYMNSFDYPGGGSVYIQDTTNIWNIFGAIVYDKGGWVLHMLRHVVGDSLFFVSLENYRDQYTWSYASTEDFQRVVENTAGIDLGWFFQEWIYGTGRPYYVYSHLSEPDSAGGWNTYLHISQVHGALPEVYTMPIDIRITSEAGDETKVVLNNRRVQNFVLHTDTEPFVVTLDPDRWISRAAMWEDYTFHIITDTLADGVQTLPYADTVLVKEATDNYRFEMISGTMPEGWVFDPATGVISGTTYQAGEFTFMIRAYDLLNASYKDSVEYAVHVAAVTPRPGDADADGAINIGDVVFLIRHILRGGPLPPVPNWGDVNADCQIDLADVVCIVNYIFRGGPDPQLGCVE